MHGRRPGAGAGHGPALLRRARHLRVAGGPAASSLLPGRWRACLRQSRLCPAMALMLTGEPISATEAHRIGLVNRVLPAAEVLGTAYATADALLRTVRWLCRPSSAPWSRPAACRCRRLIGSRTKASARCFPPRMREKDPALLLRSGRCDRAEGSRAGASGALRPSRVLDAREIEPFVPGRRVGFGKTMKPLNGATMALPSCAGADRAARGHRVEAPPGLCERVVRRAAGRSPRTGSGTPCGSRRRIGRVGQAQVGEGVDDRPVGDVGRGRVLALAASSVSAPPPIERMYSVVPTP